MDASCPSSTTNERGLSVSDTIEAQVKAAAMRLPLGTLSPLASTGASTRPSFHAAPPSLSAEPVVPPLLEPPQPPRRSNARAQRYHPRFVISFRGKRATSVPRVQVGEAVESAR